MGNKKSLINLAIFLIEILVAVGGLTLLRLGLVDSGLNDVLLIGVGLLLLSFGLSWLVIWLRYKYLPRNNTNIPAESFLGNAFLLAVIGIISTQIIYVDTGIKYQVTLKKDYPIDTITVKGEGPGDGPILSQINDPARVQKIVNFVNSRGKRWHRPVGFDPIHTPFIIEFYASTYGNQYMAAEGNSDTLYTEGPGEPQYYVELTKEEAKYFYDLLGASP